MEMRDSIGTENEQVDPVMHHSIISGRNKIRHVFQQLMSVMEEERKITSGRISVEQEELRG